MGPQYDGGKRKRGGSSIDAKSADRVVRLLGTLLDQVLSANDGAGAAAGHCYDVPLALVSFYAINAPPISVSDYLERIYRFSACSPACLITAMIYIERLVARHFPTTAITLTRYNVHRIVVTAVLLAAKFLDDRHYDNRHWAQIAGISTRELNALELDFLRLLDWRLHVSQSTYCRYYSGLISTDPSAPAFTPATCPPPRAEVPVLLISAPEVVQPISAPEGVQLISAPEVVQPSSAPEVVQSISAPEVVQPISAASPCPCTCARQPDDAAVPADLPASLSRPPRRAHADLLVRPRAVYSSVSCC